jgi:hypothetical protein
MINSNVVKMDSKARSKQDFQSHIEALNRLDWLMQIQLIIRATGLPDNEMLKDRFAKIPGDSTAGRFGHAQFGSYICSPQSELGLEFEWSAWEKMITAYRYKSFYGIYLDDVDEIIVQYNDVFRILGHVPANGAEYNMAKDAYLIEQKHELTEKFNSETSSLKTRIEGLIISEREINAQLNNQLDVNSRLTAEFREKMKDMESKIILARELFEMEKVKALEAQRDKLVDDFNRERTEFKIVADQQIFKMNEKIKQTEDHYNSSNYVSIGVHMAVQEELDNERANNRSLLVRLKEANLKLDALQDLQDKTTMELSMLQKTISEQTVRVDVINSGLESGRLNISPIELQDLKDRIDLLETYLEKFRSSSNKWKKKTSEETEKNAVLQKRIEKLNESIKVTKSNLEIYKKKLEKAKNSSNVIGWSGFGIKKSSIAAIGMLMSSAFLPTKQN